MAIPNMSDEEIRASLRELEQAIYNHEQWADKLHGKGIADRLREELASLPHHGEGQEVLNVTVSIGLTLLDPELPVEQSIDRADKALYVAKATGRDRTIVWDASMNQAPIEPEQAA